MKLVLEDNLLNGEEEYCYLPIMRTTNKYDGFSDLRDKQGQEFAYFGQIVMEKYFTVLDNRPEESTYIAVNEVGIAECSGHAERLQQLTEIGDGDTWGDIKGAVKSLDGGVIAAIIISIILCVGCVFYLIRRRRLYNKDGTFATGV